MSWKSWKAMKEVYYSVFSRETKPTVEIETETEIEIGIATELKKR